MQTVEQMMTDYAAGKLSFDELLANFTSRTDWTVASPAPTDARAYADAEEMPGPNDTFWLDYAVNNGDLTYDQYKQLYAAVAQARGTQPA